jgi:hypothetical protein
MKVADSITEQASRVHFMALCPKPKRFIDIRCLAVGISAAPCFMVLHHWNHCQISTTLQRFPAFGLD